MFGSYRVKDECFCAVVNISYICELFILYSSLSLYCNESGSATDVIFNYRIDLHNEAICKRNRIFESDNKYVIFLASFFINRPLV